MPTYKDLKASQIQFRKDAMKSKDHEDKVKSQLLTTLIGEISSQAKRDGKDPEDVTPVEITNTVKKFLKSVEESIGYDPDANHTDALIEKELLEWMLPQQLSEDDLRKAISVVIAEVDAQSMKDMGRVMGELKKKYDGEFDGKQASGIVKEILS